MSGFTGINRERARSDILSFDDAACHALVVCHNTLDRFFSVLAKEWASPIAKAYTEQVEKDEEKLFNSYWNELENIISGAYEAANHLLNSNGEEPLAEERNNGNYIFKLFPFHLFTCKDSNDGKVGMGNGVRIALDLFKTQYVSALDCIDDLPEGISFYDPDDKLLATYNNNLKKFKQRYKELFDYVAKEMDGHIKNEADKIEIAKERAVDTLVS